ncbi:MAG TPA: transglutaminase family protein [Chthonomonadales bacterium]|nr:transglutaminase family protein [Chthonomonadales bacterium]
MRLRVFHSATIDLSGSSEGADIVARLMPQTSALQACEDFAISARPDSRISLERAPGGVIHLISTLQSVSSLEIDTQSVISTRSRPSEADLRWRSADDDEGGRERLLGSYGRFLAPTDLARLSPEAARIGAVAHRQSGPGAISFLTALTRLLHRALAYARSAANTSEHGNSVIPLGRHPARDFLHLMLIVCRLEGIPARYVSGYLYTGSGPDEPGHYRRFEEGPLQTANGMHGWVECLLPNEQWQGFDPINNRIVDDRYVTVHTGRDYSEVEPFSGVPESALSTLVQVTAEQG